MFCTRCGAELQNDARFCSRCGLAINSSAGTANTRTNNSTEGSRTPVPTPPRTAESSKQWLLGVSVLLLLVALWIFHNSGKDSTPLPKPATKQIDQPAGNPPNETRMPPLPAVPTKLYFDGEDTDEEIASNISEEAPNYGFRLVSTRSQADFVLQGSAGVIKKPGLIVDSCVAFYGFDVLEPRPKHKDQTVLRLSLGIPNDMPCLKFGVARNILYRLRDQWQQAKRIFARRFPRFLVEETGGNPVRRLCPVQVSHDLPRLSI